MNIDKKKPALRTVTEPEPDGFLAMEKWWTTDDAGPWGCPIGVELAFGYQAVEETV